jgi:uncharacterized protein (TIGR03435 family)
MRVMNAGLLVLLTCGCLIAGQAKEIPQFDVASVKPHEGPIPDEGGSLQISGPRITIPVHSLLGLVMYAYRVKRYQVTSATPLDPTFYDIVAQAESGRSPTVEEFREMLQGLLADRFRLQAHREVRDTPVYALVTGKNGPKLKPSGEDGESSKKLSMSGPNFEIVWIKVNLDNLADNIGISAGLDRPVVDQTGLKGNYDIKLTYTQEPRLNATTAALGAISIFEALREQLGLALEKRVAKCEFVVVDHAGQPSRN